jgi:hypothetical protein
VLKLVHADQRRDEATFPLKAAQVGQAVVVLLTATDASGSTTVSSDQVGPVADPAAPTAKKAPVISGVTAPGRTLTGSVGTWSSVDKLTLSEGWELCPGQSASGCTPVGATSRTLKLTSADACQYVMFEVTAADAEGQQGSTSVFTATPVS